METGLKTPTPRAIRLVTLAAAERSQRRDLVALEALAQVADELCQRGRVLIEIDEYEAA